MLQEDEDAIQQSILDGKDPEMHERFRQSQRRFLVYEKKTDSPVAMDLKNMTVVYDPEATATAITATREKQAKKSVGKRSLFTTSNTLANNAYNQRATDEYCKTLEAMYFNAESNDEEEEEAYDDEVEEVYDDDGIVDYESRMDDVVYSNRNAYNKRSIEENTLVNVFQRHRKRLYESATTTKHDKSIEPFAYTSSRKDQQLLGTRQTEREKSRSDKQMLHEHKATTRPTSSTSHDSLSSTTSSLIVMMMRLKKDRTSMMKDNKNSSNNNSNSNGNKPSSKKRIQPLEKLHLLNAKKAEAFAKSTGRTISDKILNSPIYLAHGCDQIIVLE
ncbi:hypothetical protein BDF22DRAFT_744013 [Syncephalis plumigaleata]|nr:hypothetical protein BDF22DRAFT_744013 [Syncephalis plumigaleata]